MGTRRGQGQGAGAKEAGKQVAVIDRPETEMAIATSPREEGPGLGNETRGRAPFDDGFGYEHRSMAGRGQCLAEGGVLGELFALGETADLRPKISVERHRTCRRGEVREYHLILDEDHGQPDGGGQGCAAFWPIEAGHPIGTGQ